MFDSHTMPVWIALIIIIAILIPCVSALRVYSRYRRVAKTLPAPRVIQQIKPGMLDEKRDSLASGLLTDWQNLPDHDRETTREALWTAMLLEAVSDGNIDPRELEFVADLFERMGSDGAGREPVVEAAERVHGDQKAALRAISGASAISDPGKEYILAGAFLVSLSDHALAESETDCMGDIADALAISQRDRKAMFKGITKRLDV